eukprot:TRINITY_DN105905_c0_g1_i1.p1 TRINITY_DN105905_c0_g1~~TRINITY_DN105905_c0_g1_i1.p1  ORF type:complete len:509 (-),score=131.73 TRINITY_DN105905_c0_g1_i1:207-1700(-)
MGAAQGSSSSRPSDASTTWKRSGVSEATFFDVYEVGDLLGSGSFGQVRQCWLHDDPDKKKYAVKVIDTRSEVFETAGPSISAKKEANILQSVSHEHIVKLLEVFTKERHLFLVMDCIVGGELFQALSNPRIAITEGCISNVGCQLLQALDHLHGHNIVHRDVKAENILLLDDPAKTRRWHIKLVDFGLAMRMEQSASFMFKMCQQEAPFEQLICGTAYYCAPEVWFNDYAPSVDVWAAGVVLYLALFGQFPFYDKDPSMLEVLICEEDSEPSYRPVCAQDHPGFQVSSLAVECLKQLLMKAQEDRPDASTALQLPWLDACRKFEEQSQEWWPSSASQGQKSSGFVAGVKLMGSWDQVIPPSLRAKAGRAALPPAIEAAKEERRTRVLQEMKMRSFHQGDPMKVVPTPNRGSTRVASREASRESRSSDIWGLGTRSISRNLELEAGEGRENSARSSSCSKNRVGIPVLYDLASTAETLSDSEAEETSRPLMPIMCACH